MRSLRWRIALAGGALAALVVLAGGGALGYHLHRVGERQLRGQAQAQLRALASGLEFEHGRVELHHQPDEDVSWSLRRFDGTVLAGDAAVAAAAAGSSIVHPDFHRVAGSGLCAAGWFQPREDDRSRDAAISAAIIVPTGEIDREQRELLIVCLIGSLATALGAALAISLVLQRMLRPHATLAEAIAELDPHRRGMRIVATGLPAELQPVAERVNGLCDRLEAAYRLATAFHASAAHELRTPLAGLRATIEVAGGPGGDPTAALATCHQIVGRMEARVANLLLASRLDAGQVVLRRDEIDVHDLLRQAWQGQAGRAEARGLVPTWDLQGPGLANGDLEAVRMLLANLLDNAVSHASGPGPLELRARSGGGWLTVEISNPSLLDQSGAARLAERGNRDPSTSSDARHAGLGMGICRSLIELLGGRFAMHGDGTRFRAIVTLPESAEFAYW